MECSIRVVTTLDEFKTLHAQWNTLLKSTAADNLFLTWEWLYTWTKHYLEKRRLWIVLTYNDSEQLVGIAPFYIRRTRSCGVIRLREMRFLGTEEVCPAYMDIIAPEKKKKMVLQSLYRHLHGAAAEEWDLLTLSELPAESSTLDLWDDLVQEAGKVMEVTEMTACPVVELSGCVEDFLNGISANERYNLKRKWKRLQQAGRVTYERISAPHDIEQGLQKFIRLHQMRWEGSDTFRQPRFLRFHQAISLILSESDWIHLDFLLLDGEPIAGIYGYGYNGRYYFYLPGFNPTAVPQASPGILLLFHCIKEAIYGGYREFDLLRGCADYKRAWATHTRRCVNMRLYNRHPRAALAKLLESGKSVVKILIR